MLILPISNAGQENLVIRVYTSLSIVRAMRSLDGIRAGGIRAMGHSHPLLSMLFY